MVAAFWGKFWPKFQPCHATFETGENSPKFGARNDCPQPPRMVIASNGFQLKASFALLVPPTSLYWSWRQEASNSKRRSSGSAFCSLKIGMFSWSKVAQTFRERGSWVIVTVGSVGLVYDCVMMKL